MTWPIPAPDEIFDRVAAGMEQGLETPERQVDARSPNTVLGVSARVYAEASFDQWLFQRWVADELMLDTAFEWLPRHGNTWGVPRLDATFAAGDVTFSAVGAAGATVPISTDLKSAAGVLYRTQAALVVPANGTGTVRVKAVAAGSGGNLAAGAVLALVAPIAGLAAQSATVAVGGIAGGGEIEDPEAWRARILARIRNPPQGGSDADYEAWARAASAEVAYVAVKRAWVGEGSVGIVIAMRGPRAPTAAELDQVTDYLESKRPTTARVVVLGATMLAVPVTLSLDPDTPATRSAVQIALAQFFVRDAGIGVPLRRSRLDEAISSAAGEYSHGLTAPPGDVIPGPTQLPVLGAVTFT